MKSVPQWSLSHCNMSSQCNHNIDPKQLHTMLVPTREFPWFHKF